MRKAAVLAVVMSGAGPALAQGKSPQDQIDTALTRANQAGIPVTLLESKIAEGKAKGVSMDRIAVAVERREAALERASKAIAGAKDVNAGDLSVAADALDAGVSEAVLRALADTAPRDRRAVAIAVLTQLVQLGYVPQAALDRVNDALKRGPDALLNLPAAAAGRGTAQLPTAAGGRGGAAAGPPASVPAPGGAPRPTTPGVKPTTPAAPTGRGGRG
ncbi:MAG: hypothetical protein HY047_04760 [Acidobacteria bacterium]|nr:hypothetical protein [Acidobacteriota bacterium]